MSFDGSVTADRDPCREHLPAFAVGLDDTVPAEIEPCVVRHSRAERADLDHLGLARAGEAAFRGSGWRRLM